MTHALSKFAATSAAAVLAGALGAAQAAPKSHNPHPPPSARSGFATPAPSADPHVIYAVEQLVTDQIPSELQAQMVPIHTLREIEDLLKANNIAFKWGKAEVRSSDLSPEIRRQIAALPPGEVFMAPQGSPPGQIMVFGVILGARPE